MLTGTVQRDATYVLNHCTRYLARDSSVPPRHDYRPDVPDPSLNPYNGQPRARVSEAWRFPIVDAHGGPLPDAYEYNQVTFVLALDKKPVPGDPEPKIELRCTAAGLYAPVKMERVAASRYWAVTLLVRKGEYHRYRFVVDGKSRLDEVNPQTTRLANGDTWSAFFTWACTTPISFDRWEFCILDRLCRHILPFNTAESENFLKREANNGQSRHLYRLDTSVGVTNFIDKLVAREERHLLFDYKTCLELCDTVLRRRNPFVEPALMDEEMFVRLYNDMASNPASLFNDGWDKGRYDNPLNFLNILRRHAMTGTSHPKYGGNAGAMAWRWLDERFGFNWQRIMEPGLWAAPGTPEAARAEYKG